MRAQGQQKLSADETATLLTHVRELQVRLLVTAVVLVAAGVIAYLYYKQILDVLRAPLNAPLYYNSVSGSFAFVMKICMVAGIAVSVPLIVYNFIMFVRPAFIEVFTKKRVFLMTIGSVVAAVLGAVFGFTFIIPGALHFFSGFQVHGLNELISADSYLNFVINVLITFVLMFQLPIIISLIDRIKPISPRAMFKGEKWALIGSIIISLIIPFAMDVMTQLLIAAPIFILYNLSFLVIFFQHSYSKKAAKAASNKEVKAVTRSAKRAKKPLGGRTVVTVPVAATHLSPHPQLAEVLMELEGAPALSTKRSHLTQQTMMQAPAISPSAPPYQKASPLIPQPTADAAAPSYQNRPPVSMDGMSRVKPESPMQPATIIRRAGTIQAPQRSMTPSPRLNRMNMMSDIR